MVSVPPPGMASLAFRNRFRNTCCSLPVLPWIGGSSGYRSCCTLMRAVLNWCSSKRQRVLDDAIQIDVAEFGARSAREVQQAVDDLRSAEGLARDLLQQRRLLVVAMDLLGQHLRIRGDDRQRRVDFVRDARRQQADRRQLLRLRQLRFQLDALGDVVHDDQPPDDAEVFADQRSDGDVGDARVTGCRAQPELVQVVDARCLAHPVILFQERRG